MAGFAHKIAKKVVAEGGCLVWTGATFSNGLPQMKVGPRGQQKTVHVRRLAFVLYNGYEAEFVNQSCGNPRCLEPDHLVDGTNGPKPLTTRVDPDWSFAEDSEVIRQFEIESANLAQRYHLDPDEIMQDALIRMSVRPPKEGDTPRYLAEKNCQKAADLLLRQRKKEEAYFESLEARDERD